jgi:Fic family protein
MLAEVTVSLPPLIADLAYRPPATMSRTLDAAARAVIALDSSYGDRLGALGRFLIHTEAASSSKIESIEAGVDDYVRATVGIRANPSATSMVAAAAALSEMVERAGSETRVTVESILAAHRTLMADDPLDGRYAGRFRDVQNWIGGSDHSPRDADHVPPPPETVADYMADLVAFANRDDLPAIPQAAIVHAQFESIHPFTDGNGRIGRALINAVWRRRGLTTSTVTPVASALVADRPRYFALMNAYRGGEVDGFIGELASAALVASQEATVSARRFETMPEEWRTLVRPRAKSAAALLLYELLDHPVISAAEAEALVGGAASGVYAAIDRLVEVGILHPVTERKRDRVWVATDVVDELDDLARRIESAATALLGKGRREGQSSGAT